LLPAIFLGFTVHELAHALVAFAFGDTSQLEHRRLSLNPLRHVSMIGLLAFLAIGLGWAKPVSVDASRFRIKNRNLGMFLVSIAGVTANVLTALVALLGVTATIYVVWTLTGTQGSNVLQYMLSTDVQLDVHGLVVALSYYVISVNLVLALFNLIPVPPLDGFLVLASLIALASEALKRKPRVAPSPAAALATPAGADSPRTPAQIHFEIGLQYHRDGQMDEAIARYRQAIGQGAGFALAYYNMGVAYWAKGRLDQAETALKSALQPGGDPGVRAEAASRLRELALAGQSPGSAPPPSPPPLEPGPAVAPGSPVAAPLDPTVRRRLWLRLSLGSLVLLIVVAGSWVFVTAATYLAMVPK
jgi:Zn-dependent protease